MFSLPMRLELACALPFLLLNAISAAPAPQSLQSLKEVDPEIAPLSSNITDQSSLDAAVAAANGFAVSGAGTAYLSIYGAIKPSATPDTISAVIAAAAFSTPTPILAATLDATLKGLSIYDKAALLSSNSSASPNNPTLNPKEPIFPKSQANDAPYSLSEAQLRSTLHFPAHFTYGQKPPVLFVPGAGVPTNMTYRSNLFKLLEDSSFADIVWIDNPQLSLEDAQMNAEYVAYAVNFISGVCNNANVSIIAWSQGTADTQWALKYWPSTNKKVTDYVALSPEFHGTQTFNMICPGFPKIPCDPSLVQQTSNSQWVTALRQDNGDSAYVPTTTIYSSSDQIVQPQTGNGASGFISNTRQVGASNYEIQTICAGQPGGSLYTHEGVLFSPLTLALIEDALKNPGPGMASRLDLKTVCSTYAAPGLVVEDVLATESVFNVQGYNILAYEPKVTSEPALMAYAGGH